MIDVVLSDDVDFSNGSATPYPTNRIVIYANPPVSESALRYTNDWGQLVITHELTHIFHLDRTRGIWSLGQHVFGRAALLFPNLYAPSWLTEGLAVYEESELTGAGRIEGSEHRMIARAAAIDHIFPSIGGLSLAQGRYPFGESAYALRLAVHRLPRAHARAKRACETFVEKSSGGHHPVSRSTFLPSRLRHHLLAAWREFRDSVARSIRDAATAPLAGWRELTNDGVYVFAPRWISDSSIIYSGTPGREIFGAFRVDLNGKRRRIGRRNSRGAKRSARQWRISVRATRFHESVSAALRSLGSARATRAPAHLRQATHHPDVRADGVIVATQIMPGATRLVRVSRDGKTRHADHRRQLRRTVDRAAMVACTATHIAASRWLRGNISQIVVLDTAGRLVHIVSSGIRSKPRRVGSPDDSGILL